MITWQRPGSCVCGSWTITLPTLSYLAVLVYLTNPKVSRWFYLLLFLAGLLWAVWQACLWYQELCLCSFIPSSETAGSNRSYIFSFQKYPRYFLQWLHWCFQPFVFLERCVSESFVHDFTGLFMVVSAVVELLNCWHILNINPLLDK